MQRGKASGKQKRKADVSSATTTQAQDTKPSIARSTTNEQISLLHKVTYFLYIVHCTLYLLLKRNTWLLRVAFPRLVYLANWLIIVYCTRSYTISTPGVRGSCSGTLAKCLSGHCDSVPMTCALGHSRYRTTLIVHTHTYITCLLVKPEQLVGSQEQVQS
jgi:hypothetical protein